jgi:hypothetical protein
MHLNKTASKKSIMVICYPIAGIFIQVVAVKNNAYLELSGVSIAP